MLELAADTTKCRRIFRTSYIRRSELNLDVSSSVTISCVCPFLLGF